MMLLAGIQKVTLLDYPGEVACTVFTRGCNLRCPFCQNPDLVVPELCARKEPYPEEEFFQYLTKRRGRLSGVAVSGGEPTLHADLPEFLGRIRELGYKVKLDTNGMRPEALCRILGERLADYVAMDVKNSPEKYALTCGMFPEDDETALKGSRPAEVWECARESISLLMEGSVPYEFRTTVVGGLHTLKDIEEMARHLSGARAWYLQQFTGREMLVASYLGDGKSPALSAPSAADLWRMKAAAQKSVPHVSVRGV